MTNFKAFSIVVTASLILIFAGCDDNSTGSEDEIVRLYLSPAENTISSGGETTISLEIQNCYQPVFGISAQLSYDDTVIEIAGIQALPSGSFFGEDAVYFAFSSESVIRLAVSRIQGQPETTGSGSLCSLAFNGIAAGNSEIMFLPEELHFYDSAGEEVEIGQLELSSAEIVVN